MSVFATSRWKNLLCVSLLLIGLTFFSACDFTADNPGATPDDQLNQEVAVPSIVAGMERAFAEAMNYIAYEGGAVSLEINAAGSIAQFGISTAERQGDLLPTEGSPTWDLGHTARFTAEDGAERMREILGEEFSSSERALKALLWVGYSNRMLGENYCYAIIDGGEAQSRSVHFDRAEQAFTEAIDIAQNIGNTQLENAARAGRAQINVNQGDWDEALSDAELVPRDFEYHVPYFSDTRTQYNRIYWANANDPYRAHTVADTYVGPDATEDDPGGDIEFSPVDGSDYYVESGDSRVPYDTDPEFDIGDTGEIAWFPQLKHDSRTAPIILASGTEMELIRAEYELVENSDRSAAMGIINDVRAQVPRDDTEEVDSGTGVSARSASNLEEAWGWLKRERQIELWLEGRRMGDRRRWIESDAVPNEHPEQDLPGRDLCWPPNQTEIESNPNIDRRVDDLGAPYDY